MFDPILTLLLIFHATVLIGSILYFCKKSAMPWRDWPFVIYIIVWADLILASNICSIFESLDSLSVYIFSTIIALLALLGLFAYIYKIPPSKALINPPKISFTTLTHTTSRKILKWFLVITLALIALSALALALSVYPDNADSMIYRLPRAFWYVSNGSFLHPFDSADKRIIFYPLNGVALYVPLVLYNLPGTAHNFPSYLTWLMLIYSSYRFARELGAERILSLFAAWLVVLTPSILAQATSTNDEILTAVSLLTGMYMGWRWLVTGARGYFLLAAIAVGISVGTKLHIVFLAPVILAAFALAAWNLYKNPKMLRQWLEAIGWRTGIASLLMIALMVAPFLIYNYISCGRFYFVGDFAHDVFNLSASLRAVFQNLLIYLSQMAISPIADLNFWPVANDRQGFNHALNAIFDPLIMPLIDQNPALYHMSYRFVGITLSVSVRFVEFSLWSGFVWLLWPIQSSLALRQSFSLSPLFFLLALTPPIWLLFWSLSTLYMEGTATYFTYYLICASPAAAFSFAPISRRMWNDIRWVLIVIVAISNLLICNNLLMFSGFRALPDLYYAKTWPFDWDLFEKPIIDEIRAADRIRILITHEKMPYFAYMHWHPDAHYYSPYKMDNLKEPAKVLQILPISSMYEYGFMPLKIPNKNTLGVTYLGTIRAIGREAIFAIGNNVHTRFPSESDYIIPHVTVQPEQDGTYSISIDPDVVGLNAGDNLELSFQLTTPDKQIRQSDWQSSPDFTVKVAQNPHQYAHSLTIIARSSRNHKELTRATYMVSGEGAWLPDGSEY